MRILIFLNMVYNTYCASFLSGTLNDNYSVAVAAGKITTITLTSATLPTTPYGSAGVNGGVDNDLVTYACVKTNNGATDTITYLLTFTSI